MAVALNNPFSLTADLASIVISFKFERSYLTSFRADLFSKRGRWRSKMQYWAYYISIFIMGLTLLIHLQLIAAPTILVPIGFLLAIVFIATGVSAAMKIEVDLDFIFHKNQDKKDFK